VGVVGARGEFSARYSAADDPTNNKQALSEFAKSISKRALGRGMGRVWNQFFAASPRCCRVRSPLAQSADELLNPSSERSPTARCQWLEHSKTGVSPSWLTRRRLLLLVKHLPYFAAQGVELERFANEVDAGVDPTVVNNGILRIAAGEDGFDLRTAAADFLS
jgi:hypothetical protein